MSERFKLYKSIENFIDNECIYKKNSPFTATFSKENGKTELLPKIMDNSNFIQCIMNIPKEKESLINQGSSEFKVNVTDSSFEFVLYKSNNFPSVIKCLLLLIVNDIEKSNDKEDLKQEKEKEENGKGISDINNEYKLLEKLKKFIDEEFEIIDYTTPDQGKEVGCVIWICRTKEGKQFSVRPSGNYQERKKLYREAKKYIGKMLTVRYQELTNGHVPRFPVGVTIRDYE